MGQIWLAIIGFLSAVVGAVAVVIYNDYTSLREEASLVQVFAHEFMLQFKRCITYYGLWVADAISFSALFAISDSAMVTRFAEITKKVEVLHSIVQLKADFFQVMRWVEKTITAQETKMEKTPGIREITIHEFVPDADSAGKAIAFFMGDLKTEAGAFSRTRYKEYRKNIEEILRYLEEIYGVWKCFRMIPFEGPYGVFKKRKYVKSFIKESRDTLVGLSREADQSRLKEREKWERAGKKFTE